MMTQIAQPPGPPPAKNMAWIPSGEVNPLEIDMGLDEHSHLIAPEQRVNLAMAFQ